MSRYLPLICLALLHTLVDTSALLVAPLWPELRSTFQFGPVGLLIAFIVQSMPTSVSQAVFGYLRDRRATPYWLWLGPLLAAVFLTAIGVATNQWVLFALFVVGGIGVGAFHPEAAVTAGRLFPEHRTRALSIFMFGGSLGLALGPTLSGIVVEAGGLFGLIYLMLPIVLLIVVFRWAGRFGDVTEAPVAPSRALSIGQMLEGRAGIALAILAICSLRLVPNMAMDKVIAFTLEQRKFSPAEIGRVQSLFLISASAGMFFMVFLFRSGWEKRFMIVCPAVGIPLLLVLGLESCPQWLMLTLLVPTGFVLWGTTPAMVSYSQQLFPKGAGLASAITMGLAWGLGGLMQAPITAAFSETPAPQHAFLAFIPCLAFASVGAWFLPSTQRHISAAETPVRETAQSEQLPGTLPEPADA